MHKTLAIDCEYEAVNPAWAKLRSYSYSWEPGSARFLEWSDKSAAYLQSMLDSLDGDDVLVMHQYGNCDCTILQNHGIRIPFERLHDTLVMLYVLQHPTLSLKGAASDLLGMHMTNLDELTGSGKKAVSVLELPQASLAPYACADADATGRLYSLLRQKLEAEPALWFVYDQIERPCMQALTDMQIHGVMVDWKHLDSIGKDVDQVIQAEREVLLSLVGRDMNLESDKQRMAYVYGELNLPVQTNSKTGHASLDKKAVTRLRMLYPTLKFLEHLPSYDEAVTLRTRYINGLPKKQGPDGWLHPVFNAAGAGTGRMASEQPNYQQMPIRTRLGARIREAFVAPQGKTFVGGDYSQLELRTLALVTRDTKLTGEFIRAHQEGTEFDIHTWVANNAGIPRRAAKILTFGRLFGQGADAAYQEVVFNFQEAGEAPPTRLDFDRMYAKHAQILSALPTHERNTRNAVLNWGYVETYYGRRMRATQPRGPEFRSALSMGPQGTGGDTIKLAIPKVWKLCKQYGCALVGAVHDELCNYVPNEHVEGFSIDLKQTMESVVSWPLPLVSEVKHGRSWAEAH